MPTPCRMAETVGYRAGLECEADASHPTVSVPLTEEQYWGSIKDITKDYSCAVCGSPVKAHWWSPAFRLDGQILYGKQLPPGMMYWEPWHGETCHFWDNCDGKHLHVVLPNGVHWDIDGRATNCTLPNDRTHRCWIREGIPPNVTAGKNGHTCSAGAGSILSGNYHGFLRNGVLT